MKNVDVVQEITIAWPRNIVANYAVNPDNAPKWYVNIKSVEWKTDPPVHVGSRIAFVARFLGKRLEYTYQIAELVPEEKLVMQTSEGPFPMETSYTWGSIDISSTHMVLRNRGRPSGFSGLFTPLMKVMMKRAMQKDLLRLKEILEKDRITATKP